MKRATRRKFLLGLGALTFFKVSLFRSPEAKALGIIKEDSEFKTCIDAGGQIEKDTAKSYSVGYWCRTPEQDKACEEVDKIKDNYNFRTRKCEEKVICTELHRQRIFSRDDLMTCNLDAQQRLTPAHLRGYHVWAIGVVQRMRGSRRATAFWLRLARARTNHIKYLQGKRSQRDLLGHLLCLIVEPACWLIGKFYGEQDLNVLYGKPKMRTGAM